MQYDIFISYKRKGTSSATAAYLYELLLRKGYNVFFDRKEMRSGKFNDQLLEHISGATDVIILLEEESLLSWFAHKDDAPRHRPAMPSRDGSELAMGIEAAQEAPYKTDWFCREVMHALSQKGKNVIPILLNGYQMPAAKDLPPEMKDLAMLQALSLDISEIEETYQKYFVEKEYLKSKPRNLAISRQYQSKGGVVGSFLFYTEAASCELFECGERIITLTDDHDEDHPFRLPVTFAGEHRFRIINNDTCEELRINREIETNHQRYIHVEWSPLPNLWALSDADIEAEADADTLFRWGRGLFEGTAKNAPDIRHAALCMECAIGMGHDGAREFVKDHGQGLVTEKHATHEDAFRWYSMSAELGNVGAQINMARFYEDGTGVAQDYAKAIEWYSKPAEHGDREALFHLGFLYQKGYGVAQDYAAAVDFYAAAAEQGSTDAMRNLGCMYVNGWGVERDYAKAVALFERSAELGDVLSYFNLSVMYDEGQGVEQDDEKSLEWCTKAAEKGYASAQSNLGYRYANGQGVEPDDAKAVKWWTKAADQGDAAAQHNLGFFYENGRGVAQNYTKALDWYTKAAEQGHAHALFRIGGMYDAGRGVEQDYTKALDWYTKAAEQGNVQAQFNVGALYYNGLGAEQSYAKAAEWWLKAAEQGHSMAQLNVGVFYEQGLGVEQDNAQAAAWLLKSAEHGGVGSYNTAAWAYHLLGRYDEALPWAEKALEAQPDDANVSETLATVYQGLGRLDESLAEFRRCLELKTAAGADEDSLAKTLANIAEVEALIAQR